MSIGYGCFGATRTTADSQPPTSSRTFAQPMECLADLLEIGLIAEAHDFAQALNARAKVRRDEIGPT